MINSKPKVWTNVEARTGRIPLNGPDSDTFSVSQGDFKNLHFISKRGFKSKIMNDFKVKPLASGVHVKTMVFALQIM